MLRTQEKKNEFLPLELVEKVLDFTDPKSLANMAAVSKRLMFCANEEKRWKKIAEEEDVLVSFSQTSKQAYSAFAMQEMKPRQWAKIGERFSDRYPNIAYTIGYSFWAVQRSISDEAMVPASYGYTEITATGKYTLQRLFFWAAKISMVCKHSARKCRRKRAPQHLS